MALWLATHPCVDCGESNIITLEFDHKEKKRSRKHALSLMTYRQASIETIRAEIDRCVVRCANCHRIKTHREQNWYAKTLPEHYASAVQNLQSATHEDILRLLTEMHGLESETEPPASLPS